MCLRGEDLRHLNPDERTTAALLKKALAIVAGPEWSRSTSGIFVRTGGLATVLSDLKAKGIKPVYLREDGTDIHKVSCRLLDDAVFILGDHMGMTPEEETQILQAGADVVSIGPASLHADHCIVIVNWMLDIGMTGDQTPKSNRLDGKPKKKNDTNRFDSICGSFILLLAFYELVYLPKLRSS